MYRPSVRGGDRIGGDISQSIRVFIAALSLFVGMIFKCLRLIFAESFAELLCGRSEVRKESTEFVTKVKEKSKFRRFAQFHKVAYDIGSVCSYFQFTTKDDVP